MMPSMNEAPALIDLQILSPMAWVEREKNRVGGGKVDLVPNSVRLENLRGSVERVQFHFSHSLIHSPAYKNMSEEQRRGLEWHLIQTAALAVLWLEALRREEPIHQEAD